MPCVCLASCDASGSRTRAGTCRPSSRSARSKPHQRLGEERETEIARESVNFGFSRSSPRSTIEELSREKSLATDFLLILSLSSRHRGDREWLSRPAARFRSVRNTNYEEGQTTDRSHQGECVRERVLELNVADSFLFVGLSCSQGRERDTERGVGASIEPDYLLSARARSRRSIARASNAL